MFVLHQFRPGETITAILRLRGRHDHTQDELAVLMAQFNELNGAVVPRQGETFKIPLLAGIDAIADVQAPVKVRPGGDGQEPSQG